MRRLVYYVAVSLDGCIAAADGDYSAFLAEGDHMRSVLGDFTDALPGPALEALGLVADRSRFDTVVMGWNTYAVGLPAGLTDPYPHLRTVVFSRGRAAREVPAPVTLSTDDPVSVVRALKAEPDGSDIWLCGGGQLAGALHDEIDALVLKVNPITLGDGIGLFGGRAATGSYALTQSTAFDSGVVISHYDRVR